MTKRKSPCYKCDRRCEGCHGSCEDYKAYQAECRADYSARKAAVDVIGYEIKRDISLKRQWERKQQTK